tara:strand:+ start:431 stop:682 length:252 start_codon:yes stop_codon:yes gene_type:complete
MFRHKILSGHLHPLSADMRTVYERFINEDRIIKVVPPYDSNGDIVSELHFDSEGSFEDYQKYQLNANDIVTADNIIELEKLTY